MPLSVDTHRARLGALSASLAADGIDALVLYGMGSGLGPATRSHGSMRFLTGWDSHHNASVLVVRPSGATLFVTNIFSTFFARDHVFLDDVRFVVLGELSSAVASLCRERAGPAPRLASVGRAEMPAPLWEALAAALPGAAWQDATDQIDR